MSSDTDENGSAACQRIEDFIFVRELNEVFLLLDHISGRWDKSLHNHDEGVPSIDELCAIGLTPPENEEQRVTHAARLLCAKDRLNWVARPATGLTIGFTLLVVGEDNQRHWSSLLRMALIQRMDGPLAMTRTPHLDKPTRLTLARFAFLGLVRSAGRFRRWLGLIVLLLLVGLVLTCVMSWHVTGGDTILQHLDNLQTQQTSLLKEITEAETKHSAATGAVPVRFCSETDIAKPPQFRSTEEYQLCTRQRALAEQIDIVRLNLSNWLGPWRACYGRIAGFFGPLPEVEAAPPSTTSAQRYLQRTMEEQARVVTLVVGTAVLPLCYGILGAGAAVVRGLRAKLRESMLSPRDLSSAVMQLALGATIGACIALFINPSGQAPGGGTALLGNWTLGASALSFVAGFGVEGVFVALESLVRRVFNITDPTTRRPAD